jgi:class 3 adenylate cyclase
VQWLEELGMSEYSQRFAENRIDLSVLPDLTDQDLEKLGVVLGDRRKMLRAIANLYNTPPAAAPAPPPASAQPIAVTTAMPAPQATGERLHVTVMFCDLVDSTGIAAKLDAEEWRDLVGGHLDAASAAVTEMGGKVAKKLGDGLMALLPSAQCGRRSRSSGRLPSRTGKARAPVSRCWLADQVRLWAEKRRRAIVVMGGSGRRLFGGG